MVDRGSRRRQRLTCSTSGRTWSTSWLRTPWRPTHARRGGVLVGPAEECRFERLVRMANVADGDDRYAFDPEAQTSGIG